MASAASRSAGSGTWSKAPRHRRRALVTTALLASDAIAILAAGFLATVLRFGNLVSENVQFEGLTSTISYWELSILIVPLWIVFLALARLYDLDAVNAGLSMSGRVTRALSLGFVGLVVLTYLAKLPGVSRPWSLLDWALAVVLVLVGRGAVNFAVTWARQTGRLLYPTLVVGSNAEAADILRLLRADRSAGLVPVGCLASSQGDRLGLDFVAGDVPIVGTARDLPAIMLENRIDAVVIASSAFDHDVVARMIAELRSVDADVHISSGLFEVLTSRVVVTEVAGVPLVTVKGISLTKGNQLAKRAFDLLVSAVVVIVGLPIWLAIALAIKLTSRGPILYAQERVGINGTRFGMLKFRSMYVDADERLAEIMKSNEATGPLFKIKDDPRITPAGIWLRKFSLDEFPQIINVLKGEMSLVGPRPPLPREVSSYSMHDWRRLEVVPGMTGLWQVSGRSSLTFDEMVRLDLFYIENWSIGLDVTLIFRTIPAVIFARGAY
jgi:exopolysaccharide biosynthesis polyprenyl glycosylphosphotransferase